MRAQPASKRQQQKRPATFLIPFCLPCVPDNPFRGALAMERGSVNELDPSRLKLIKVLGTSPNFYE
eukprot:1055382-Pelagomonas_calceolata.AAC.11